MEDESLISLRDITKTYQMGRVPVLALQGLSLEIGRGEMVAIMGPSGSGKTTLLNVLGCLDWPSRGSYKLNGQEVARLTDRRRSDIRNRELGFIFQSYNMLPRVSAIENAMVPLVYAGLSKKERRQKAEAALTMVGLQDRMRHRPSELSGGEQQRVAIARALVNDPSVILADEPTGNLDSRRGGEIMDLLQTLHEERGITLVMVTHDQSIADRAHRIVSLRDGLIDQDSVRVTS